MNMKILPNNLQEQFNAILTEWHATEKKLGKGLSQLSAIVHTDELRRGIAPESTSHNEQLERMAILLERMKLKSSRVSDPLSEELIKMIKETAGYKKQQSLLKDAQILHLGMQVFYHRVAVYTSMHQMLTVLQLTKEAELIAQSLSESKDNAGYLMQIGQNIIYPQAAK